MSRRVRIVLAVVGLVLAGLVLRLTLFAPDETGKMILASGTVEATDADLGFQVAGRIESIAVREGAEVEEGRELAVLDRRELLARRRMAEAQAVAARATLEELTSGFREEDIGQARAALRAAESRRATAAVDVERARNLRAGGAISQQSLDHAESALEMAQADVERSEEALRLLVSGPRAERIAAQEGALAQAEAAVEQAEALLDFATIRAPFRGRITVRHREPGEAVTPGAPVLTVMNPDDRWVRIYVPARDVGRVALGQPASITADAYDARTYPGEVVFIASEAEFTPRNVQTTEERVKLVYQVKVRIVGDPDLDLKPGLAADVRLEVPPR